MQPVRSRRRSRKAPFTAIHTETTSRRQQAPGIIMQAIIRQMLLRSRTAWKAMRQTAGIRIRTIHSRSPQILRMDSRERDGQRWESSRNAATDRQRRLIGRIAAQRTALRRKRAFSMERSWQHVQFLRLYLVL